ncbi:hypothetical protein T484DRAFT_2775485 [Baffinella frigidus]|nr:hypothetical protein T484DRAFT_2775485 [Cryptophyta sp. CCMP2293]
MSACESEPEPVSASQRDLRAAKGASAISLLGCACEARDLQMCACHTCQLERTGLALSTGRRLAGRRLGTLREKESLWSMGESPMYSTSCSRGWPPPSAPSLWTSSMVRPVARTDRTSPEDPPTRTPRCTAHGACPTNSSQSLLLAVARSVARTVSE